MRENSEVSLEGGEDRRFEPEFLGRELVEEDRVLFDECLKHFLASTLLQKRAEIRPHSVQSLSFVGWHEAQLARGCGPLAKQSMKVCPHDCEVGAQLATLTGEGIWKRLIPDRPFLLLLGASLKPRRRSNRVVAVIAV